MSFFMSTVRLSLRSWRDKRGNAVLFWQRDLKKGGYTSQVKSKIPHGFAVHFTWWLRHQKSSPGTRVPPAMQAVSGWLGFKACKVSPFRKMDEVPPERKPFPPSCSWVFLSGGRNFHIINKNVTSLSMVWALNRHKNNRAGLFEAGLR